MDEREQKKKEDYQITNNFMTSIMQEFEEIQKLVDKLDTDWKDLKEQNTKFEKSILELHKPND